MKPPELVEVLKGLDQEKEIICQVVAKDGKAWNVTFEITKPKDVSFNVMTVSHPNLKTLPDISQ